MWAKANRGPRTLIIVEGLAGVPVVVVVPSRAVELPPQDIWVVAEAGVGTVESRHLVGLDRLSRGGALRSTLTHAHGVGESTRAEFECSRACVLVPRSTPRSTPSSSAYIGDSPIIRLHDRHTHPRVPKRIGAPLAADGAQPDELVLIWVPATWYTRYEGVTRGIKGGRPGLACTALRGRDTGRYGEIRGDMCGTVRCGRRWAWRVRPSKDELHCVGIRQPRDARGLSVRGGYVAFGVEELEHGEEGGEK